MADDFRALCAELLQGLDENRHPEVRYPGHLRLVIARARAALAEGDGAAPSDEELDHLCGRFWVATGVVEQSQAEYLPDHRAFARAVLARYGTHPRPIPVAERLPSEPVCWLWDDQEEGWIRVSWIRVSTSIFRNGGWSDSWWLPAAAIPLPQEKNDA
jgi:hypothetical protein